MKRIRTYYAWCLLIAAITFALPRTWMHHCNTSADQHELDGHADHSSHVEEGNCNLCDFAATSSLAPLTPLVLTAPDWQPADEIHMQAAASATTSEQPNLRGPPAA